MVRILNHDALDQAVGSVATRWAAIEAELRALIYDLATYNAADYENDATFQVLIVLISHMDVRQTVANAKALAHTVKDPADFYDRAEALLNWIDNDLRNERNRCIHDRWILTGPIVHRIKAGTVIKRSPPSGERKSIYNPKQQYIGIQELIEFADKLEEARFKVSKLGDELRETLNRIRPLPE